MTRRCEYSDAYGVQCSRTATHVLSGEHPCCQHEAELSAQVSVVPDWETNRERNYVNQDWRDMMRSTICRENAGGRHKRAQ